jgi:NAD(P) transhydrogenase
MKNNHCEEELKKKFDVVIIGAGPAGEQAAMQAAYFGKRVALIEKEKNPGGACVNTGTLPSKTFRETALHLSGLAARGIEDVKFSLESIQSAHALRKRYVQVARLEHTRIRSEIQKYGITYIEGTGKILNKNCVQVFLKNGSKYCELNTDYILISTGTSPYRPSEINFDDRIICDSDSILNIEFIPKTLTIIGAGVIGSEYASIFASLGTKVFLCDQKDTLLPFLDLEISKVLKNEMQKLGVDFYFNKKVKKVEKIENKVVTTLSDGTVLESEMFLFAQGRNGNTEGLGLENVGVKVDKRGLISVNEHYQTCVENIYACGDVIGFPALASTSMDQGRLAMCHAFGLTYRQRLPEHLPLGIYTIPEVSAVGETEETAKAKGIAYEVGRAFLAYNARAEIMGDTGGMLKILFDVKTLNVIGVHLVCERASELITTGLLAVRFGIGIDYFIDTVFNYPTISEAYKTAAYDGLEKLIHRGIETGLVILGGQKNF